MTNREKDLTTISVIVPVYNAEEYLARCLESLLHQTYTPIEIVLVDDASTDSSARLCEKYATENDNVFFCRHDHNQGLGAARNTGLKHASGQYVGFVDSDDFVAYNMYEALHKACIRADAQISTCGITIDCLNGTTKTRGGMRERVLGGGEAAIGALIRGEIDFSVCNKLFHRTCIQQLLFPEDTLSEDIPFVVKALKASGAIATLEEPLYHYVQRADSLTEQKLSLKSVSMVRVRKETRDDIKREYPRLIRSYDKYLLYFCRYFITLPYDRGSSEQIVRAVFKETACTLQPIYLIHCGFRPYLSNIWKRMKIRYLMRRKNNRDR